MRRLCCVLLNLWLLSLVNVGVNWQQADSGTYFLDHVSPALKCLGAMLWIAVAVLLLAGALRPSEGELHLQPN